jgi:gamma-glutamyltranspeptidase
MILVHLQTKRSIVSSIQRPQSFCTALQMALSSSSQENDNTNNSVEQQEQKKKNPFVITNVYNGIVASDQSICSQLGLSILQDLGGNAIDAAVTTALCLGVVNPASSGLGGGAFILIQADSSKLDDDNYIDETNNSTTDKYTDARVRHYWSGQPISYTTSNGKVIEVIDARETAPESAYTEMFSQFGGNDSDDNSVYGGLSIAVPGELRGLEVAHIRHGTLPWDQLIEPVIELAKDGIAVSKYLANVISNITYKVNTGQISYNSTWRLRQYITKQNDWNSPLQEGDIIHNTNLLRTLVKIRDYGADGLYDGINGEQLASDIQTAGGIITAEDIQNYRPIIRTPVVGSANGFTIVGVPPPSSGGAVIIGALRFLSYFTIPLASFPETLSAHRIVEAMKHVFSIRMSLCDPAFSTTGEDGDDDSVEQAVYDLIAGDYMQSLRQSYYSDNTTMPLNVYGGSKYSQINTSDYIEYTMAADAHEGDRKLLQYQQNENDNNKEQQQQSATAKEQRRLYRTNGHLNDGGTSHISIVDKFGNAVSLTTSINTVYGSLVVSPSTGIVLANTMDDFSNPINDYFASSSSSSSTASDNYFGIPQSEANYIQPGKKPLSSMSPTFVYKENEDDIVNSANDNNNGQQQSQIDVGELYLVVGGSGGPKIITSVLQVIINYLFMGRSLLKSVIQPRLHNQLLYHGTGTTTYEKSIVYADVVNDEYFDSSASKALHHSFDLFPFYKRKDSGREEAIVLEVSSNTISALHRRNHYLTNIDYTGTVQAIAIDPETSALTGVSDIRKRGTPSGY